MLTHYMQPQDILPEFWQDLKRSTYWMTKQSGGDKGRIMALKEITYYLHQTDDFKRTEIVFYDSPKTGNHWMMWDAVRMTRNGLKPEFYRVCFRMLEKYMCVMVPTTFNVENKKMSGVTIYTPHLFLRMHERLGVDMTDRLKVIRNFCENFVVTMMDIREPRGDEKHDQIVCRLPGSWMRGHFIRVKGEYVIIYRTYYTDKTLTPYQFKELKSFRKVADKIKNYGDYEEYLKQKQQ